MAADMGRSKSFCFTGSSHYRLPAFLEPAFQIRFLPGFPLICFKWYLFVIFLSVVPCCRSTAYQYVLMVLWFLSFRSQHVVLMQYRIVNRLFA